MLDLSSAWNELNSPVYSPPLRGFIGCNRILLSHAACCQPVWTDTIDNEEIYHRIGPLFRQFLIELIRSDIVGMPDNPHRQFRITLKNANRLVQ